MYFSLVIVHKDSNQKFLKNCIESLEKQTFKDFEVLFLHNGSGMLEEALENTNLKYKIMENDLNINEMRNIGIKEAQGEFVFFIDSDDFLHPNALIYAKQIIDEDSENRKVIKLGITKTNIDMKTTLSERKQAFYQDSTLNSIKEVLEDINISTNIEQQHNLINGLFEKGIIRHKIIKCPQKNFLTKLSYSLKAHSFLINRDLLLDHEIWFDEKNDLHGETPFLIHLYNEVENIYVTHTKLYYKFIHNDPINYPSLTQREIDSRLFDKCRSFNKALKYCENKTIARQIRNRAISYYLYKVIKNQKFKEDYQNLIPIYEELKQILNFPCGNLRLSKRHEYEIKAIQKGKFKLAYYLSKARLNGYKTYQFIQPINQRFRQKKVQKYVFSKLPIKENTILYESFLGRT